VLQRPLLRRGNVRSNVETGLRFRGVPRREAARRADAWLERLGIAHLANRRAHALSGGEAQRVSLARALVLEPRLLLLDEPFAAVDAPTRSELLADLRGTLRSTGAAALLVTHDWREAAVTADRIAVLCRGQVRQEGPCEDVLDHPVDAECARLLGYEVLASPELLTRLGTRTWTASTPRGG
jgi:ABC-type sulfate/molybdate transport systems ATPase subunit